MVFGNLQHVKKCQLATQIGIISIDQLIAGFYQLLFITLPALILLLPIQHLQIHLIIFIKTLIGKIPIGQIIDQ